MQITPDRIRPGVFLCLNARLQRKCAKVEHKFLLFFSDVRAKAGIGTILLFYLGASQTLAPIVALSAEPKGNCRKKNDEKVTKRGLNHVQEVRSRNGGRDRAEPDDCC